MQPEQQNSAQPSAAPGVMPGAPAVGTSPSPAQQAIKNPNSSQNSLLISEIRDAMTVMNDGSFRAVVACQSINFDLMSDREREGVEYSYQSFLNSLYFPVQVFIRSQRVDIGPYLERLSKMRRDQDNMLLGVLMDDYLGFIDQLSQEANIMDKSFFIVVPYYPAGDMSTAVNTSKNLFTGLFKPEKQTNVKIDQATYNKAKEEISNRVNAVVNGLFQMGVKSSQLGTKELASLYYNIYNPDTAVRQPLVDFEAVTGTYVEKGQGVAPQPHLDRSQE
ncbi:MAG: hypothetical protein ABIQ64_02330 [Candidatus Saccharimonadales bacterium]